MRFTRLKIALVAASVCTTSLFAGAGTALASASGCTYGTSGGNTQTCFSITNQGLFVEQMTASATVENSGRTLQVCIHGPDSALPLCTPFQFVAAGDAIHIEWMPNRNVTAGTYCGRTWRLDSGGVHTLIGEVCYSVP